MPTQRHLNAVAHDIAHHAVSGLSYIHPHLGQVMRELNIDEVELNLLSEIPLPPILRGRKPLDLSSQALRSMFHDIVRKKGFELTDVKEAILRFCFSRLVTSDGREFNHRLES
jgi:hypothetical protein